jgi:hypothetical protein
MAICDCCDQEMSDSVSCTWKPAVLIDTNPRPEFAGVPFQRITYPPDGDSSYPENCVDCAAPQGGLHHPGCDVERCPACGGQAISCNCRWEGDDYEADEDD